MLYEQDLRRFIHLSSYILLDYFDEETDHGKLYINYPMMESIRYTDKLPDEKFEQYTIRIDQSADFKKIAGDFSYYKNLDFISFRTNKNNEIKVPSERKKSQIKENWCYVIGQHLRKANKLCSRDIQDLWVPQKKLPQMVFEAQKKLLEKEEIAILNAYPLFLLDYFGEKLESKVI